VRKHSKVAAAAFALIMISGCAQGSVEGAPSRGSGSGGTRVASGADTLALESQCSLKDALHLEDSAKFGSYIQGKYHTPGIFADAVEGFFNLGVERPYFLFTAEAYLFTLYNLEKASSTGSSTIGAQMFTNLAFPVDKEDFALLRDSDHAARFKLIADATVNSPAGVTDDWANEVIQMMEQPESAPIEEQPIAEEPMTDQYTEPVDDPLGTACELAGYEAPCDLSVAFGDEGPSLATELGSCSDFSCVRDKVRGAFEKLCGEQWEDYTYWEGECVFTPRDGHSNGE